MKHLSSILLLLFAFSAQSQNLEVVKFPRIQQIMDKETDTTYVMNFWATWCKPCVDELPAFEQLHDSLKNRKVKVILVNLDFREDLRNNVIPFLRDRNIQAKVLLLDETDYDEWISKVEESWSGSLPATLIFNPAEQKRKFLAKKLDYQDLDSLVTPMLN